jgi:hypothetical protein
MLVRPWEIVYLLRHARFTMTDLLNISTYVGRFLRGALILAPLYALYQVSNHMPILTPHTLPVIFIDRWTPFLPWTGWVYVIIGYTVLLLVLVRDPCTYSRALRACAISFTINSCFWFLYPTVMERPPLPDASFANFAYRMTVMVDTPANCFPSGHLTFPLIACWAFVQDRPSLKWVVWPLFGICSISVLTTKQHYFVDIPAGVAVSLFSLFLVYRTILGSRPDTTRQVAFQK